MADLARVIEELGHDKEFLASVTHWERLSPREGSYEALPNGLDPRLSAVLLARGISRLYSHQADAYREVLEKRNVVVVTPTASGKTLCYNLPVLNSLLADPSARALYLFPTKALSQDQQSELNEVVLAGDVGIRVATYDGDTPSSLRVAARDNGRIIITNPDMLHTGILPNHPKWIKFMSSLKFIVIDEVHVYRGVFGSHMTNLIRRLKRIVRFYGNDPLFICSSATIGNPLELAKRIIEEDAVLVDRNGAPSGERHVVFYNPPLVDRVQGIRRGVVLESRKLALHLLTRGIKTIVFARSRVRTELIASYINASLANLYTDNHRIRVESYRGGYLPSERRDIERGLRSGEIQGVVSTNALELGIDIGGLDASVLAGFPGSIASSWQQAGRAGRRTEVSLAILVASASPLDQYMVTHPQYFFSRSPESGYVDPDNPYILTDHAKCAVFELPFDQGEEFGGPVDEVLALLEESGVVRLTGGKWYWSDRSYPAEGVSLRSATSENVVIVNTTKGATEVIGEMDRPSAKELLFDGAVYIHRGAQYMVTKLDMENRRCFVEESDVNYYTDALVRTDIKLLSKDSEEERDGVAVVVGDVLVRSQVTKYKKLKFQTHENIGYGDIALPEEQMHTRAVVLSFPEETVAGTAFARLTAPEREEVVADLGTLVKNVAPLFLLCAPSDIGVAERLRDPELGMPALYVYDMYPGGTGLSEGFLEKMTEILSAAMELLRGCECEEGCPSCIGPAGRSVAEGPPVQDRKGVVTRFLAAWLPGPGRG